MTVEELIEKLKTVNPKAKVVVNWLDYEGYYCENENNLMINDEGERVVIGESPL